VTLLVVAGLVFGGIYAIASLGLVLTYVSSRIFNFAHASFAFFVALAYYDFHSVHGWPTALAAVVSILVIAPLLGLFFWAVLFRRLASAPTAAQLVATIGLSVALPPIGRLLFIDQEPNLPPGLFRSGEGLVDVLGITLNANQIAVFVSAAVVAVSLAVMLRFTVFGLTMRAVVDHRPLASVMGINASGVTAVSWMLGATLAGLAGVLLTPVLGLNELSFSLLLIASFAAVVIGRLRSMVWTFIGAILLGLSQTVVTNWLPSSGWLPRAARPSLPFIVMIVFLAVYGTISYRRGDLPMPSVPMLTRTPAKDRRSSLRQLVAVAVVAVVALIIPTLVDSYWLGVVASGAALAVAFLSYTLVTGEGGMISLCQISLAGIGAMGAAQLTEFYGWPPALAILVAAAAAVPFGLFVAFVGLRLGELYLALATLSFAVLADNGLFTIDRINNFHAGQPLPRPAFFGFEIDTDVRFFYLALVVFLVFALVVVRLRRSTSGMTLAAVRSSETAARTIGVRTVRAKLVTFGLGAFIAGIGGALFASFSGAATPQSFGALIGLVWLAVVVTWGIRSVVGALLAGVSFTLFPALFSAYVPEQWAEVPTMLFGLGAIVVAREPRGIVVQNIDHFKHFTRGLRRPSKSERAGDVPASTVAA
jgi:branched-chain amino acid transport system permease protein